eukprot:592761-Rhodomonas_salina.2
MSTQAVMVPAQKQMKPSSSSTFDVLGQQFVHDQQKTLLLKGAFPIGPTDARGTFTMTEEVKAVGKVPVVGNTGTMLREGVVKDGSVTPYRPLHSLCNARH